MRLCENRSNQRHSYGALSLMLSVSVLDWETRKLIRVTGAVQPEAGKP